MLAELRLKQYRSYSDDSFELSPGVTIIVGPNGSGKTNLLEAILVIARGKSYRAKDAELIQHGHDWARLDARLNSGNVRSVILKAEPKPSKEYTVDGKQYKRLTLNHSFPVVLFEPNHLLLLSGSPEGRRSFLDDLLEQTKPGYGTTIRHYRRILAQRNALLKQHASNQTMFPWNVRLAEKAGEIIHHRTEFIHDVREQLPELYQAISRGNDTLTISYISEWTPTNYVNLLLQTLEKRHQIDTERGFTTSGPHRDDIGFYLNGFNAQDVASRGELRTAVLALKIIELQTITKHRSLKPVFLLDDVFSELDGARRRALTEYLDAFQTIITTTDADLVLKNFTGSCTILALQ